MFQGFHIILKACQKAVNFVLNKKIDYALIKESSSTCVGYHHSKRGSNSDVRDPNGFNWIRIWVPSFSESALKDSSMKT